MTHWHPIATALKDGGELLLRNKTTVYVGRFGKGLSIYQPQYETTAWRASCCGRFTDPTEWMPIPGADDEG